MIAAFMAGYMGKTAYRPLIPKLAAAQPGSPRPARTELAPYLIREDADPLFSTYTQRPIYTDRDQVPTSTLFADPGISPAMPIFERSRTQLRNRVKASAKALQNSADRAKAEEDYKNEYLDAEIRPEHAISNDIQQQHADFSGFVLTNSDLGRGARAREHQVSLPNSQDISRWHDRLPSVVNHETTHAYDPMVRRHSPRLTTEGRYYPMVRRPSPRSKYFGRRDTGDGELPAMAVEEATSMRQFPKTVPADTNLRRAMLKYAPGTADVVKSSPEIWKYITALRSGKGPYRPPGARSPYSYGAGHNEHDPAQNLQAAYKNWVNFQRRGMPDKGGIVDKGPSTAGPYPYPGKDPATKRWSDKNIPKIDDGEFDKARIPKVIRVWRPPEKEGAVRAGFLAGYIPNNEIT